MSQIPISPS